MQTEDGIAAWAVISKCAAQLRIGPKGLPYGIDFAAILALAEAMGARSMLLADVIPSIEPIIVDAWKRAIENGD